MLEQLFAGAITRIEDYLNPRLQREFFTARLKNGYEREFPACVIENGFDSGQRTGRFPSVRKD